MYQLVLTCMAITLTAIVVAGGASYMSPDFGNRRITSEVVTLSYRGFDAALAAYRASNGGALPPGGAGASSLSGNAMPWPVLRPYLGAKSDPTSPGVALAPLAGTDWYYLQTASGAALCLATTNNAGDPPLGVSARAGIALAAGRARQGFVGPACGQSDPAAASSSSVPFAATFLIQAGQ